MRFIIIFTVYRLLFVRTLSLKREIFEEHAKHVHKPEISRNLFSHKFFFFLMRGTRTVLNETVYILHEKDLEDNKYVRCIMLQFLTFHWNILCHVT